MSPMFPDPQRLAQVREAYRLFGEDQEARYAYLGIAMPSPNQGKRDLVSRLLDEGLSYREILRQTGIAQTTTRSVAKERQNAA